MVGSLQGESSDGQPPNISVESEFVLHARRVQDEVGVGSPTKVVERLGHSLEMAHLQLLLSRINLSGCESQ
jgi:hypothetical protein